MIGHRLVNLNEQLLDLSTHCLDLSGQLRRLVLQDGTGNHWARDTASAAQCDLGWDKDVWHVLCVKDICM